MSINTTPATVSAAQVATAALWNAEVRDPFTGIQAPWTAYTPTLTGITLGNGTLACAFIQYGKNITVRGRFVAGSTTSFSATTLAFSLPVAAHAAYAGSDAVGSAVVAPTGNASRWTAAGIISATGTLNFLASSGVNAVVTNLVPGTFTASTAFITFTVNYQAA